MGVQIYDSDDLKNVYNKALEDFFNKCLEENIQFYLNPVDCMREVKEQLKEQLKTCGRCIHDGESGNIVGSTCYMCKRNPEDHRIDWFEEKKKDISTNFILCPSCGRKIEYIDQRMITKLLCPSCFCEIQVW